MTQLTRRDAMKAAAAGLLLPGLVTEKGAEIPERLMEPLPIPPPISPSREHVVVMGGCRIGTASLINRVNADVFLGCQPGTLRGICSNWWGEEGGLLTMRWSFLEAPTWGPRVTDSPASDVRVFTVYPSMLMQPVCDAVIRDCQSWEWTVDGKVVLRWRRPGTIRQKPYMGDEDGTDG